MKVTRFLLSVLLLGVTASASSAQVVGGGTVQLSWQNCVTPPIDRAVAASTGQKVNASVIGQTAQHKAYDVRVTFGSPGGLRDAWRFDAGGCADGLLVMNHVDAKTCVAFQGGEGLQIKKWTYDPLTGRSIGLLANAYANTPGSPVAGTRYLLASFNFDHSFSVAGPGDPPNTCGGFEIPVCAVITYATWLTMDGAEVPFTPGQNWVTANDPNNSSHCPGATPVQPKTWGSLKSQYRN